MSTHATTHEQALNIDLADQLKTKGLDTEPEQRYSSGRPDVESRFLPLTIARGLGNSRHTH